MNGTFPSTVRYSFSLPAGEAAVLEDAVRTACKLRSCEEINARNHLNYVIRWAVRTVSCEIIRRGWTEFPFAVDIRPESDAEFYERVGEPRGI